MIDALVEGGGNQHMSWDPAALLLLVDYESIMGDLHAIAETKTGQQWGKQGGKHSEGGTKVQIDHAQNSKASKHQSDVESKSSIVIISGSSYDRNENNGNQQEPHVEYGGWM